MTVRTQRRDVDDYTESFRCAARALFIPLRYDCDLRATHARPKSHRRVPNILQLIPANSWATGNPAGCLLETQPEGTL